MIQVPYYPTANDGQNFICLLATVGEMLAAGYLPVITTSGKEIYWVKRGQVHA